MKTPKVFLFLSAIVFSLFVALPGLVKADVLDTTPPVITAPADQSFATTTIPAFLNLVPATATDDTDSNPVITYSPLSFPLGTTQVIWTATDVSGNFSTTTSSVTVTNPAPVVQHITLTIRDGGATAYTGSVVLPDQSALNINIVPTNTTTPIAVSPRSVLGILETLQASTSTFQITELDYYSSYPPPSFYINCISIPAATSTPDCSDWTDVVNGSDPGVGIDRQLLNDGDVVYLFFKPHQTILSTNSVVSGQSFTATTEQYDYVSGTYKPLTGVIIGVGTPQTYPTPFTEIATSTVDSNGQALFTISTVGSFSVGIQDDYYFPAASITINSVGTGTGGGTSVSHTNLNIPQALSFISSSQSADGSFGSPIVTDWTAIAFVAADPGAAKTKLRTYLLTAQPAMFSVTDYERHAMALEAMGINPYTGTPVNYIAPIVSAFDGTQIGSPALDNDDIFALIALEHAGFNSSDLIIQKDAAFILSEQKPDGSWDETPDMTSAGIQAIGSLFDLPGVNGGLGQAAGYLASTEQADGSWNTIDSTSWVQTAINAIIEANTPGFNSETPWTSSKGFYPTDAIAASQQPDGGVTSPNRVWSTSYAVTAASGKSWVTLLQQFSKPAGTTGTGGGSSSGSVLGTSTPVSLPVITSTSTPTSTPVTATTTVPSLASTTIPTLQTVVPTTTSVTVTPKPKVYKHVKPKIIQHPPEVLGEATTTSQMISAPPQQDQSPPVPAQVNSDHPGFFTRVWHSVASFFGNLF
jgi:hypothetical protein